MTCDPLAQAEALCRASQHATWPKVPCTSCRNRFSPAISAGPASPPGESSIDPAVKDIDPIGLALDRARTYVHWIEEHWASFEAARESDPQAAERVLANLAHSTREARLHLARLVELLLAGYPFLYWNERGDLTIFDKEVGIGDARLSGPEVTLGIGPAVANRPGQNRSSKPLPKWDPEILSGPVCSLCTGW